MLTGFHTFLNGVNYFLEISMLEKAFFQTAVVGGNLRNIFLHSQRSEIINN